MAKESLSYSEDVMTSGKILSDIESQEELRRILEEMKKESNLGESFDRQDYVFLFVSGLIIPAIIMIWGWML